jgi:hypothetical protein
MQNIPAPSFNSSSLHTHPTPYPQGPYPYDSSNEARQHYEHNTAAPVKPAPANPHMPQHPQHGPPAFGDSSSSGFVSYPPGEESTPIPRPTRIFLPGEPLPPTVEGSRAWHYNMNQGHFLPFNRNFVVLTMPRSCPLMTVLMLVERQRQRQDQQQLTHLQALCLQHSGAQLIYMQLAVQCSISCSSTRSS